MLENLSIRKMTIHKEFILFSKEKLDSIMIPTNFLNHIYKDHTLEKLIF
jgi:hypothetical protein